jgi:transcription termination/antitermination protein NusG
VIEYNSVSPEELPWFAVAVKSGREQHTSRIMANLGFAHLLPTFLVVRQYANRARKLAQPLFPGYVFCQFDPTRRLPILQLPYVMNIVANRSGPVEVARAEIQALRKACIIDAHCEPWPYLTAGQLVTLVDGPLRGVTGRIAEVRGIAHLVLSVTLLQRSVALVVRREWICPTEPETTHRLALAACGRPQTFVCGR